MRIAGLLPIVTWLLAAGCVRLPQGPNVMVLPGTGKSFDQFTMDDAVCRRWAEQRIGESPTHTADTTAATGAAIGTVVGAAGGAAIGAAAGFSSARGAGAMGIHIPTGDTAMPRTATITRRRTTATHPRR